VWLRRYGIDARAFHSSMGTIGAGNHFCELQEVDEVVDQAAFDALVGKPLFLGTPLDKTHKILSRLHQHTKQKPSLVLARRLG
jgi:hypothetical protein